MRPVNIWLRLSATFHEHPKMLAVRKAAGSRADSAELGWYRLLMAAKRYGRWSFASEAHLEHVAGPYYRFVPLYRAERLLDDLTVHDGESYNAIKTPAERKAEERERSRGGVTPVRDMARDKNVTLEQTERVDREQTYTDAGGEVDILDAYYRLTTRFPTSPTADWLERIANEFGATQTIAMLVGVFSQDKSPKTLISRLENELRAAAHAAERAGLVREKERLEADAKSRKITPEQAEANRERLAAIYAEMMPEVAS